MTIEIRDADLEARLRRQLQSTGPRCVEELLFHLLETQEAQDRWLLDNREAINSQIRRGIEQLDELKAHLAKQKAKPECSLIPSHKYGNLNT